ncbi:MAG: serine/threonine-protein kinase [Rubrivivax sp.]
MLNLAALRQPRSFEETAAFPDTAQFQDTVQPESPQANDDGFADTVAPDAAPATPVTPLTRLPFAGRFELIQLLGQGTVGTVHAARDHLWMRLVALKVLALPPGTGATTLADLRRRFVREAEIAQRLRHPDIVEIYEAGVDGEQAWLAMELVPGVPLSRYTTASRLLPEPVVLAVVSRVAAAVAHAHAAGVVHRDLKPGNVIVEWPTNTVKLADFGLAHLAEASNTATGLFLGSPAFMAPELLAGAKPSPASDLYALGLMLFQLLSGEIPHEEDNLGELMRRRHAEPVPDIREIRPSLPRVLADLMAEALAQRPSDRRSGVAGWGQALAALQQNWRD